MTSPTRQKNIYNIKINEGITSIGNHAFKIYSPVSEIELPSSLLSIGDYAFGNTDISSDLIIPDNVTSIGVNAFKIDKERMRLGSGYDSYFSKSGSVINGTISSGYEPDNGTEVIPEGITEIGGPLIGTTRSLSSVVFPSSLTMISADAFNASFMNHITELVIPDTVRIIENKAFYDNNFRRITIGQDVMLGISAFGRPPGPYDSGDPIFGFNSFFEK